jgi:hypothetical protein
MHKPLEAIGQCVFATFFCRVNDGHESPRDPFTEQIAGGAL